MIAPVATCPDHGWYAGEMCPRCDADGERVLSGRHRERLSKFVSGALRHFPDDAGLSLDAAGWATWTSLVDTVERRYDWADGRTVEALVTTDPKGRFETREVDGEREVRAAYGHSVDVDLDTASPGVDHAVPDVLYHGTAPRNLDAIRAEGLKPMGRRAVHLSGSRETARDVGRRHTDADGDPVVLAVDVRALVDAGFEVRKRGVDTYTVSRVPPRFLSREG
jgi:putative RNA 2'-phosphotransferase